MPSLLAVWELPHDDIRATSETRLRNRLKVARAEEDLSQDDLARLVGVARLTISPIETGQYRPSALLAFLLPRRLGKRVDELFYLEGEGC
ncbi:MAG: helix-turn-helix transcriptional regulator [Dehalococcoidia bacterium]|nr:helix-turn-helix transcriptional regulator [Dehalococcoidia bacterium]